VSIEKLDAPDLLGRNKFNIDETEPHIVIVCPAVLYKLDKSGEMTFDYAGCLECGTCRIVCMNKGIVKWEYPRGTFGVSFRHG
jgi:ferredoxin like protein